MNARAITAALGGRWYRSYGLAFCPAHDNRRTPALSLADGRDGRLLASCKAGCRFAEVAAALRDRGFGGRGGADPTTERRREAEERAARERDTRRANSVWSETLPIAGTLAEAYLRRRAIRAALPWTLRFHPACWHATAKRLPALLGAVELGGDVVAVHRTYLSEPGVKAEIEPPKAMLGPVRGGAVRLSDGPGPLVVAEGIETALSLLNGALSGSLGINRRPRVWAALSTSGVAGLELPAAAEELVVAPDPDAAGRRAADDLARRAWGLGWRVKILPPPGDGLDWNDQARRQAGTVAGVAGVAGGNPRNEF
jgi:hypothetical protein